MGKGNEENCKEKYKKNDCAAGKADYSPQENE